MKKRIVQGAALLLLVLLIIYCARSCGSSGEDQKPQEPTVAATEAPPASHSIDVSHISQVDKWPCGCESVSAVMALRYAGYEIDVDTFIDKYLPLGNEPYYGDDDLMHGDSPYEYFLGTPYSDYSFGCYAPVILKAANEALSTKVNGKTSGLTMIDLSGKSLKQLCDDYISRDIPVVLWGTVQMKPVERTTTWLLPDGSEFTWKSREHCMLLVGYDERYYYFNDPLEGKSVRYPKADVESAYGELYSQALAVVKSE